METNPGRKMVQFGFSEFHKQRSSAVTTDYIDLINARRIINPL